MKPRAVFVGQEAIGNALSRSFTEYNWVACVPNIEDVKSVINQDIHMLFLLDALFDDSASSKRLFEKMVVITSPHMFVGIINYFPQNNANLSNKIESMAYSMKMDRGPFYFIDRTGTGVSLKRAVEQYKLESNNKKIIAVLNGEDSAEETFSETDSSAEFHDEMEGSDRLGRVIAVTSTKGGSGKSVVALSIASYLAKASIAAVKEGLEKRPLKVCAIDFDIESGHMSFATGKFKPNVLDMIHAGIGENMLSQIVHDDNLKVDLILSPRSTVAARGIEVSKYSEIVSFLRRYYDYIILDTGSKHMEPINADVAYQQANQIIFVSDIVVTALFGLDKWIKDLTRPTERGGLGLPREKLAVVVNKYQTDVNMDEKNFKKVAGGVKIIGAYPSMSKAVVYAINSQNIGGLLEEVHWRDSTKIIIQSIVGNTVALSDAF